MIVSLALLTGLAAAAAAQPVITPTNLTVNAGASFEFAATVTNTNVVSFQWVFDGTNIAGATNLDLYVDNPSTNQAGVYWVVVTNQDSSVVSNSAALNVLQGTIVNLRISKFADGSSSNVVVELFDHDKPATVQNFLHYVRTVAYSNMFFERLIPGFILQGGDYDTYDRTNGAPDAVPGDPSFTNVLSIDDFYVQGFHDGSPSLPFQIDSEYYVGPLVSNVQGTLAMALPSGNPNGGANAFFFNLVDNSGPPSYLDYQQFTVFGRVISGADVLDYFNNTNDFSKITPTNLVFANNPFTNGIFDLVYVDTNATSFTDVPVNYLGTNLPANSNLFFVDWSFPDPNAQPYTDTNPPTATITFPTPNLLLTNGFPLVVQGTAYDNVGLAFVECTLLPQNGANGGEPLGTQATGTTNWSLDVDADFGGLDPGIYNVMVTPQDGAGNLGTPVYQSNLMVTAVVTNGVGTVSLTDASTGTMVSNAVGAYMASGSYYYLSAQPGTNQLFADWSVGGAPASLSPNISVYMYDGLVLTATFLSNGIPNSIAITYPPQGATVNATNGVFQIEGTISGLTNTPVGITCQLFSYATQESVGSPSQTSGTNNWTVDVTNLPNGHYFVEAIAQDAGGLTTLVTNDFTVQTVNELTVLTSGPGVVTTNLNGQYLVAGAAYSMTATAAANASFAYWSNGGNITLNPVVTFTMVSNLTLTATFISNGIPANSIAFTYPPLQGLANATNGIVPIQGTLTGLTNTPVGVTCQLFSYPGGVSLGSPLQTYGTNNWVMPGTNLANGHYFVEAVARDSAGLTTLITNDFTVQAVNLLTVLQNGPGAITTNLNGQYLVPGQSYSMTATAAANASFASWSNGGHVTLNPVETFTMVSNLTLTVTFITNGIPANSIAFTYPPLQGVAEATNGLFPIQGTLTGLTNTPVSVTCQLFSYPAGSALGSPLQTYGATNWVLPGNALANGHYFVEAVAQDSAGLTTLITNDFTVQTVNELKVVAIGPGAIHANLNGQYLVPGQSYSMTATHAPKASFAFWSDGTNSTLNPVETFKMSSNLTLTATFVSNNIPGTISFTYPAANARLTNPVVALAGKTKASAAATQVVCQLFLDSNSIAPPMVAGVSGAAWSAARTNLAPGAYTAVAYTTNGGGALIFEHFDVLARLTVVTSTNVVLPVVLDTNGVNTNIVSVASPQDLGAVHLSGVSAPFGKPVSGGYLLVGKPATVSAAPKKGYLLAYWTLNGVTNSGSPVSFSLATNETLTAYFATNYYPRVSGTYNGLFYPLNSPFAPTNSGFFSMTISGGGAASINVIFPSRSYRILGTLPFDCSAFTPLPPLPGLEGQYLALYFSMDLTNFSGSFSGAVYDTNGAWGATLTAVRAATKLTPDSAVVPGRYVLTIPGDHAGTNLVPGGDSYATYSIGENGAVTLGGWLADNTAISQSAKVSTNGAWPLYAPLYSKDGIHQGLILGWQTNGSPDNYGGFVGWYKPATAPKPGVYNAPGFQWVANTTPTNYTPPKAGTKYQIVFGGGSLPKALTNSLKVIPAGQFTSTGGQANNLEITLSRTSGAITGHFLDPAGKTLQFKGAFQSPESGGSGFILDSDSDDEAGYFEISSAP
jgi:cyclophilin family peptidyl-prolyl cis-trans isomerase/archaellum component FlaF (FlaF/FlaG flagellin family)